MASSIYIETTIVSYLSARPSRDVIIAGHQQITDEWWRSRRGEFALYTSQAVLDEAAAGDPEAAKLRLEALASVELLDITPEVAALADLLVLEGPIPPTAAVDAVHIATAAVHGVEFLLTWNCKHIANAAMRTKIESVVRSLGYRPSILCTPEELLEE